MSFLFANGIRVTTIMESSEPDEEIQQVRRRA